MFSLMRGRRENGWTCLQRLKHRHNCQCGALWFTGRWMMMMAMVTWGSSHILSANFGGFHLAYPPPPLQQPPSFIPSPSWCNMWTAPYDETALHFETYICIKCQFFNHSSGRTLKKSHCRTLMTALEHFAEKRKIVCWKLWKLYRRN